MASSQQLILGEGAGGVVQYKIERSLRFNPADSTYLNRTFGSGDQQKFTLSLWVKRSESGARSIFTCGSSGSSYVQFRFNTADTLYLASENPSLNTLLETTQVFRDYSAWYHIVLSVDTTQATSTNRIKFYVNGSQITSFSSSTYPAQNTNLLVNSNIAHYLGTVSYSTVTNLYGGYMTEVNFIDGQQLTPSSFGETNADTGVWQPKAYSGTYGTNGFYLNFSDNSNTTSTTLGKDYSGNGNNWTPSAGFSVAAGVGNDSLVDTPTPYGTDTGVGGEVRGNYCTLNPLQTAQSASAPNNGNLTSPANSGVWRRLGTTMQLPTTGKWYFEYNCDSFGTFNTFSIGVFSGSMLTTNDQIGFSATEWGYDAQTGQACARNNNSTITSGFSNATSGDVLQLAYDAATGSIWFGKNNTWQGAGSPNPATGTSPTYTGVYNVTPVMVQNWATQSVNFGQRAFAHTAPSGFKALCTQNLPTPTIGATSATQAGKYFNTVLWAGNSTTNRSITGVGFQPDFVWIKDRTVANWHNLFDAVRGVGIRLVTNNDAAEVSNQNYGYLSAFNSDGFTVTNGSLGYDNVNVSGSNYVGWSWNAGGSNASNSQGTITSTVRANTTAGFSVVTYTGNGSSSATVGHGLGTTPSMVIVKKRSAAANWFVKHSSVPGTQQLIFTDLAATNAGSFSEGGVGNLASTTFGFLSGFNGVNNCNENGATFVAYCFASIAGYSAFGSYTGNGSSDGTFVYTGFRPEFVLYKSSGAATNGAWRLADTARNPSNEAKNILYPNLGDAESSEANTLDILSNGFKMRRADIGNQNGIEYIYIAFAESPFKYSLAR